MFKDVFETLIKELRNEKNQEHIYSFIEPLSHRIRISFYIVIIILVLMVANLMYSNILLTEIIRVMRN